MVPPGSRCLDWQLQNYVKCSWPIRTLIVKNQLRASNIRMEVCYGSEFVPLIFSSIYGLAFPPVFPGPDRCQSEFPLLIFIHSFTIKGSLSSALTVFSLFGSSFAHWILPRQATTNSASAFTIPAATLSSLAASAASSASLAAYVKPTQVRHLHSKVTIYGY